MTAESTVETSVSSSRASVWEDFIDIFTSPAQVFARRENGSIWVPMLIVTAVISILFIATRGLMQPIMDGEFHRAAAAALRKNPQLTEEQMTSMRGWQEKLAPIFVFIGVPIAMFLTGLVLWLVGKLFDARESFHAALVVSAFAFVPKVVEVIVNTIQALVLDTSTMTSHYSLTLGIGRFLDPDASSPVLLALLGRVDVFTIWVTVLLAIGLSVTGKIPRSRAAAAAACVWLVGALPALIGALRS